MTTIQILLMVITAAVLFAVVAIITARLIIVAYRLVSKLIRRFTKEN